MDLFVPCCKKKKAFCVLDITNQRVGGKGEVAPASFDWSVFGKHVRGLAVGRRL